MERKQAKMNIPGTSLEDCSVLVQNETVTSTTFRQLHGRKANNPTACRFSIELYVRQRISQASEK